MTAPVELTLALPKGRLLRALTGPLSALGVEKTALDEKDRRLVRTVRSGELTLHLLLLKPDDVPTYVEHGTAQLGVVGRDVLLERGSDLVVPVDLGLGRCRLAVAGLPGAAWRDRAEGAGLLRVATKYPRMATQHFAAQGRQIEVVYLQGSVELAPLVGLAEVVVDVVETGETLRQNGLVVHETVREVDAVVAVNRSAFKLLRGPVLRWAESLRDAVARGASG